MKAIVAAESHGGAKAQQWRAANDADFVIKFTYFRAKRAPEFDGLVSDPDTAVWPYVLGWKHQGETWGCLDTTKQGVWND